jgi:hypothetical protein
MSFLKTRPKCGNTQLLRWKKKLQHLGCFCNFSKLFKVTLAVWSSGKVTRWVCEKMIRNVAQHIFCQNLWLNLKLE